MYRFFFYGCMHTHTYRSMRVCRCTEMARDTPGSPMSRPRDLVGGVGATTTTLTSSGYHTGSADPSTLHGHVLQQKILEVVYRSNSEIFFESFDFVLSLSLCSSYNSIISFNNKFSGNNIRRKNDSWPNCTSNRCIS